MVLTSQSEANIANDHGLLVEWSNVDELPTYVKREGRRKQVKASHKVVINDFLQVVLVERTPLENGRVTDVIRVLDFVDDLNREQLIEMLDVSPIDGPLLFPGNRADFKEDDDTSSASKSIEKEESGPLISPGTKSADLKEEAETSSSNSDEQGDDSSEYSDYDDYEDDRNAQFESESDCPSNDSSECEIQHENIGGDGDPGIGFGKSSER